MQPNDPRKEAPALSEKYNDEFQVGDIYENLKNNQHFRVVEIIPVGPCLVTHGRTPSIAIVRKRSIQFRHIASDKDTVVPYEDAKYYPLMKIHSSAF